MSLKPHGKIFILNGESVRTLASQKSTTRVKNEIKIKKLIHCLIDKRRMIKGRFQKTAYLQEPVGLDQATFLPDLVILPYCL